MVITVEVSVEGDDRPAPGAPIRVEARDTTMTDESSVTVGSVEGAVRSELGSWLDTVELAVETLPAVCTIWAHIDVDGDGRVSKGDFITTVAYPVPRGLSEARVPITLRRV